MMNSIAKRLRSDCFPKRPTSCGLPNGGFERSGFNFRSAVRTFLEVHLRISFQKCPNPSNRLRCREVCFEGSVVLFHQAQTQIVRSTSGLFASFPNAKEVEDRRSPFRSFLFSKNSKNFNFQSSEVRFHRNQSNSTQNSEFKGNSKKQSRLLYCASQQSLSHSVPFSFLPPPAEMIQIPLPVPVFRRNQFNGCTIGASKFFSGQSFSSQQALFSGIQIGVAFNVLKDKFPKEFVCKEVRVAFQSPAARGEQKITQIGINVRAVRKNQRSKIPKEASTKVVSQGSEKVKVQSSAGRTKFRHGQKEEKVIRTRIIHGGPSGNLREPYLRRGAKEAGRRPLTAKSIHPRHWGGARKAFRLPSPYLRRGAKGAGRQAPG